MGGFKSKKQMTKREMQEQIADQSANAVQMVQGLAMVVNQQIRNLKLETSNLAAMSIMREEPGAAISKSSIAYIDFVGTLDGKAFEGGEGIGVFVDMEVHQFLSDFQSALEGMKAGELKTVDVKFPENYQAKDLAGKTASFEIYVRKVMSEIKSPIAEKALEIQKQRAADKAAQQAQAAGAQASQEA